MKNFLHVTLKFRFVSVGVLQIGFCMALSILFPQKLWAKETDIFGKITVMDAKHHPLPDASNVVVFIDTVNDNTGFSPPSQNPEMASQNMKFVPFVLPILSGTTVSFPNKDIILHNVFSLSKTKVFDLGLYKQGEEKTVTFDHPGLVKVYCNIHQKMVGYILVLGNPYFSLTDPDGRFAIKNVPEGTYTLVCWYRGGQAEKEVIVTKAQTVNLAGKEGVKADFELVMGKNDAHHKNKWGKDYKDKY